MNFKERKQLEENMRIETIVLDAYDKVIQKEN